MFVVQWRRNIGLLVLFLSALILIYSIKTPIGAVYDDLVFWIFAKQREFHQSMTASLSALADNQVVSTAYAVVAGSFLYGVFHAAGPGHGKIVLSTYLLAKPESIGRSIAMAFAASIVQGIVAITLVYGLFFVFGVLPKDSRVAALWSERLSYTLVMGIGLWLLWRAAKLVRAALPSSNSLHPVDVHDHAHTHDHNHSDGETCGHCGHSHMPDLDQAAKAVDLRSVLGVIFSIGFRPCSGAILVLIFARFADIPLAGVAAVFAMSLGTAITVSSLALVAVKGRSIAQRLLGIESNMSVWFGSGTAAIGGIVLLLLGYGLLVGSFSGSVRSMGLG